MSEEAKRIEAIRKTFAGRAQGYERESSWMSDDNLIQPLVPESGLGCRTLLEVCAGTGIVSAYAERNGIRALRADISVEMLRRGRDAVGLIVADGSRIPLRNEAVDVVVCRQGLQYLDPEYALHEWLRVARKEVRLGHITLLSEADRNFWSTYFSFASPGRLGIFAPGDIEKAITRAGGRLCSVVVRMGEGTLGGAIRHLPESEQQSVIRMFEQASPRLKEAYAIRQIERGEYIYRQRWEFVVALK